jgi:cold shock CspA family protein/ribosome-associated translation inhibitor RaiA
MQIPPEIAFHNIEKQDWAEAEIREHIADLERIFDRLITCRVRVEQRANNSNGTIPPVVHLELGMPGSKDIVVAPEPDRLQRKYQSPDLRNAINDAFRVAKKRLIDWKEQRNASTRDGGHDGENQFLGQIADLPAGEDFGFLMTKEGGLLYFHRNSLLAGRFEDLRIGTEVSYVEEMGDTGPIASKVRVKASA